MQTTIQLESAGPIGQLQLPMLVDVRRVRLTGATALAKNRGHVQVETRALSNILSWQRASSQIFKLPALHELLIAPTSPSYNQHLKRAATVFLDAVKY